MKKLIVLGVILAGVIGFAMYAAGVYTSARNDGNTKELALTAQYKSMMASYGQDRLAFTDSIGITREKRDAMDKILTDAVSGRYNKGGAQVDNGKLFSAVKEAYPDLNGLGVYDKILDFVTRMRNKFAQNQAQIATMIQDFDTWRTTGGLLHPWFCKLIGFPNDLIEVHIGNDVYRGQKALDMMSRPIVGNDTNQIFDSGTDQPGFTPEKK